MNKINFNDKRLLKFHDWMKTKYWCIVGFDGMPYETKLPFLQMWLREVKGIHMMVEAFPDYYDVIVWVWSKWDYSNEIKMTTYTDALEDGIQNSLCKL